METETLYPSYLHNKSEHSYSAFYVLDNTRHIYYILTHLVPTTPLWDSCTNIILLFTWWGIQGTEKFSKEPNVTNPGSDGARIQAQVILLQSLDPQWLYW